MNLANIFGLDAIGAQAIVGRETERIELGTAVVPTPPRHPVAIAQQALTTQAACGGRFTLGIGLSHKLVVEDMLGLSYAKPARQTREYMNVLGPLVMVGKVVILTFLVFWFRFTFPRFREDQLQRLAWKFLIPIALANIVVTGVLKVVF